MDRQARKGAGRCHAPVIVDLDEAPDGDIGPVVPPPSKTMIKRGERASASAATPGPSEALRCTAPTVSHSMTSRILRTTSALAEAYWRRSVTATLPGSGSRLHRLTPTGAERRPNVALMATSTQHTAGPLGRRRQPPSDPCPGRAREQPQGRQRRAPEAAACAVSTGVSGSGKSSLVFVTIAAESQRLINETYSTFVQGFMPTLPHGPGVDVLDGLTTAIIVDQERDGHRPPPHGRHRHRRQRDAAHPLQPDRQPHIGSPRRVALQRRHGPGKWSASPSSAARRPGRATRRLSTVSAACVRAARAGARSPTST